MTYAELVTALTNLLDRGDLTSQIPLFIEQCESGFTGAPESGGIRHWRDKKRSETTLTAGEQYLTLPDGYVETIRLLNQTNGNRMVLQSREAMQESRDWTDDEQGTPRYYRHASNETIAVWPTPAEDTVIELEYYRRITRLNKQDYSEGAAVTENWLSQWYPDVYLYGSAVHSAPFLHDDSRITTWASLYSLAAARVNSEANRAEASTSSPRLRNRGIPASRVPT